MAGMNQKETAEKTEVSSHRLMGGSRHKPPQLAKAKTISDVQAQRIAKYAPLIQESAAKYNVPVELICGVILQESGGNTKARSPVGAKGLMQLMPKTAERFGVRDSFDPAQNIDGGTKYLRFLLDRFHGDIRLALAGYNAGEGAVEKHGNKVPPYRETQNYIPSVLGYTQSMIDILVADATPRSDLPASARRA
ncbi:MAG: lytic transglycosylase domain-containing protein [Deltaproteobacteria bacterium]|nr:lytic transglycosylase domain-containing protein [Deltaproteobacteria bacterium]